MDLDLSKIADAIATVPGVRAVALGGSQSRKKADRQSDYDIGVYYDGRTLEVTALDQRLKALDDEGREDLLNPPGAWGPWINGGAWMKVDGTPVDILLRDIKKVKKVITDCLNGVITIDYQCGHPFGFVNTIYAAETHYAQALWQDETVPLDGLKELLYSEGPYPPRMRQATIEKFLWEAGFSLACGRKAAHKEDVHYEIGSIFRTVCSWVELLFALNSRYVMNEKGALKEVDTLNCKPAEMEARVNEAYRLLTHGCRVQAYEIFDNLHREVERLAEERRPLNQ